MDTINAFAFVQGKTSVDWFFDFKLHLVVNDFGELLNITVTSGNTDSSLKLSAYPELRLFTIAWFVGGSGNLRVITAAAKTKAVDIHKHPTKP